MAAKIKTVKNRIPSIEKNIKELNGRGVQVGVLSGEHKWLASIHEYGMEIEITPKMRKWLHANGLHVKNSTTHIVIPERSFLRGGYDENIDAVVKTSDALLADVLSGTMSEDVFLELVGTLLRDRIKDYATSLNSPPNHPFTVGRKGGSNPLVDTGDMIGGIDWREK